MIWKLAEMNDAIAQCECLLQLLVPGPYPSQPAFCCVSVLREGARTLAPETAHVRARQAQGVCVLLTLQKRRSFSHAGSKAASGPGTLQALPQR